MIKPILAIFQLNWMELLILLGVALLGLGLLGCGAAFLVQRSRRKTQGSAPPPQPPSPPPPIIPAKVAPPKCPQCGRPMPVDAAEGLCPECLARVALRSEPADAGTTIGINPLAEAAPPPRVAPDPAQLAGQFPQLEIIELLGIGGMGMVYKARQPRVDRLVALKILPVESSRNPSFAERFQREAKALARLNHPGIVTFYDFGQTSDYYYFIMEYVEGMNLRQLLQDHGLQPGRALELVTQICTALQYAHDEGVVHRDIKPENILLNKKGRVKIADFGLAKLLGAAPDTALTMSRAAMGTMNYMAPEQRQNAQDVDHRADIYSLGVVFYEMLTGEVPMGRFEPPSNRVRVDVRLDEVVLRALEREPARRYQHASEVKSGVDAITESGATTQPPAVNPASAGGPAPNPILSQPRISRIALAGAACLILFAGVLANSLVFDLYTPPRGHWEGNMNIPPAIDPKNAARFVEPSLTGWRIAVVVSSVLGLGSVLGVTICGWVAVAQIRRSSGSIYGLGLAVFDGLFFPLLLANYLVAAAVAYIAFRIIRNQSSNETALVAIAIASLLVLSLNFLIVRKVWRVCRGTSGA